MLLLALLCTAGVVLLAGCARRPQVRGFPARAADLATLPPFAIVYSRVIEPSSAREIVWQRGAEAKTARVLYRSQGPGPHAIPSDFGYLPAPTGAWVFVWETVRDEHMAPIRTEWSLVRVTDGKRFLVAKAKGASGVFPRWYGESDVWLDLVKGGQKWQVDLRGATPKLDRPPPAGGDFPRDIDASYEPQIAAWRQSFVRDNYSGDRFAALHLLEKHPQELGLADYFVVRVAVEADTLEDMLLRPMGIVDLDGPERLKRTWPELAPSPSGKQVARSIVTQSGRTGDVARVDVYDTATGARLWGNAAVRGLPDQAFFCDLRWSPDGRLFSYRLSRRDGDTVTIVDGANGAEVTRLDRATNAFVVPVVGEKQGQPVIPCACTQKEHK